MGESGTTKAFLKELYNTDYYNAQTFSSVGGVLGAACGLSLGLAYTTKWKTSYASRFSSLFFYICVLTMILVSIGHATGVRLLSTVALGFTSSMFCCGIFFT